MTSEEFDIFLFDTTKYISQNIEWDNKMNHQSMFTFRVEVLSEISNYNTFLNGNCHPRTNNNIAITYAIIDKTSRERIYALDVNGTPHKDPVNNIRLGGNHKHKWHSLYGASHAYFPEDIDFASGDPILIWKQFCREANINHRGYMNPLPSYQLDLFFDI